VATRQRSVEERLCGIDIGGHEPGHPLLRGHDLGEGIPTTLSGGTHEVLAVEVKAIEEESSQRDTLLGSADVEPTADPRRGLLERQRTPVVV
jgi:hypothetical protein